MSLPTPPKKILYVTTELAPFLDTQYMARFVRQLAIRMAKQSFTVRVLAPRFSTISEHKHRIHEVIRLSGINITVGRDDISLVIKVTAFKEAKTQAYFLDNEDLFHRPGMLHDTEGTFYADNDTRALFFCKGVMVTLRKLEWAPHIIHCHGWLSSFIPLYLRTTYKNNPIFKHAKCIYSLYGDQFDHRFASAPLIKKAKQREVKDYHLEGLQAGDFKSFVALASAHADLTTCTFEQETLYDKAVMEALRPTFVPPGEEGIEAFQNLYQGLLARRP